MTDRPIPAKIILKLADKTATGEEFISLTSTLYRQHLIYDEPRELRKVRTNLELTVTFWDIPSFRNWLNNAKVIEYWTEKFDSLLTDTPQTIAENDVIINGDQTTNCSCEQADFYFLQGRSLRFIYELICGNCLNQVPYSKVPTDINIEEWQTHHERVYLNWLDSSFFEQEAFAELTNYQNGKLNLEGEKIRKQLATHFEIPVYIKYFEYELPEDHQCPICKQKGIASGLTQPINICKNCNTIFGFE